MTAKIPQLLFASSSLVAIFTTAALSCPSANTERYDFENHREWRVLKTSDGSQYACWWDRNAPPLRFEGGTYDVVIRCSETLTIYSYLDDIDQVIVENNNNRSVYQAEFGGDQYECDSRGQLHYKPWTYRRGTEVLQQIDYSFIPYRW